MDLSFLDGKAAKKMEEIIVLDSDDDAMPTKREDSPKPAVETEEETANRYILMAKEEIAQVRFDEIEDEEFGSMMASLKLYEDRAAFLVPTSHPLNYLGTAEGIDEMRGKLLNSKRIRSGLCNLADLTMKAVDVAASLRIPLYGTVMSVTTRLQVLCRKLRQRELRSHLQLPNIVICFSLQRFI